MISATATFTPKLSPSSFVSGVISPAVRASCQAAAQLIQQAAQAKCPRRTGRLADSIAVEVIDGDVQMSATVGPRGVDYDFYVEFGTGRRGAGSAGAGPYPYKESWPGMAAQPYMRPAIDESRDAILDLFASNITPALKAAL